MPIPFLGVKNSLLVSLSLGIKLESSSVKNGSSSLSVK